MGLVYLDYNATTPLAPEVLAAMLPVLEKTFGNPSSIHAAGREARAAIDTARDRFAGLIGARPHEIIFTGGGTEADNLAILGLARQQVLNAPDENGKSARVTKRKHIISTRTEHHAVLHAVEYLEKHEGYEVTWLPVDRFGVVDLEALRTALTPGTALVSIMSANNETGTLQPVAEIAALCREARVLFHSDMVQSFGKQPLDVRKAGPDAISLAAHKFYGPKGVGVLWVRSGISIAPTAFGGSHENARRPGTENAPAIVGLVAAAEYALAGVEEEQARQGALIKRLWEGIAAACPGAIRHGHPDPAQRLANTLNVSFPGLDGEGLLINFDLEGIGVSSGSACMVGSIMASHVLLAMGVPENIAQGTVRFSVGKGTTGEEIEKVVAKIPKIVDRLSS